MATGGLTAKQVEHMKPDPDRRIEVAAGPPKGLYLVTQPSGAKSWALRYRWHGRTRKLTLGSYPEVGLAGARGDAQAAVEDIEQGIDPAITKKNAKEAEALHHESVANIVEEFLARKVRPEQKSWRETERILKRETKLWSTRSISEVSKPDVLRLLDSIVDRGSSVMACRTRGVLMRFFDWSRHRGYIEQSPMIDVAKPGPDHKNRDRVLKPDELAEVWLAIQGFGYPFGPFLRLLTLTAQRRGEVAAMRWEDVDLKHAMWTLPAEMTKPRRIHDVPLSMAAVDLLNALPRFQNGRFIFTTTSGEKPINGWSKAKAQLDAEILEQRKRDQQRGRKKVEGITNWTLHDLRRTAATYMAQAGVPPQVLSALLNHSPGSVQGITSIYNRFRYTDERRMALQNWAEYVLSRTKADQNPVGRTGTHAG